MEMMSESDDTTENTPWNELLDELERELMDPSSWDESTAEVYGSSPRHSIRLVLQLEGENLRTINAASDAADMPLSRYILQAALEAAKRSQNVIPAPKTTKRRGAA
jgi:hypothetical protein